MEREDLLSTLTLASAALAKEGESVLPILAGFKFNGTTVTTYDDVISVNLPLDIGVKGILPGHQMLRFLAACSAKDLKIEAEGSTVTIKCGGAKLALPLTPVKDWPFKQKEPEGDFEKTVSTSFFRGLELCSAIVQDRGLSSWMGGVNFYFGKTLRMYSISPLRDSMCYFPIKELGTGDKVTRYIAPISFCKTALAMYKKDPGNATFYVSGTGMALRFKSGGILFTKLISVEGQNIAGRTTKILGEVDGKYTPITPELAEALKRAGALVSKDGSCKVTIEGTKVRLLTTSSAKTLMSEGVVFTEKHPDVEININPTLILKMLGNCDGIRFLDETVVAHAKDGFTYITANKV